MLKNLRRTLDSKGISTRKYAEALNVSEKTVFNKIQGTSELTYGEIRKTMIICPEYNMDWLLRNEPDPTAGLEGAETAGPESGEEGKERAEKGTEAPPFWHIRRMKPSAGKMKV